MPINLWVVQGNLGSTEDAQAIKNACEKFGCECRLIDVIPFSTDLPDIEITSNVVFYGSSNFTTNIHRAQKWTPAVFFDDDTFSYSSSVKHLGDKMLNHDGDIAPMLELAQKDYPHDEELFFRPDRDLKEFAGTVQTFGEIQAWVKKLSESKFEIDVNSQALLAKTKDLAHEWRVFMVNGKYVSGSHYRSHGQMSVHADVPDEVVNFCESISKIWTPAPVFVMDIAECNGELLIIEFNGFNSSGFYKSDIEKIVYNVINYDSE